MTPDKYKEILSGIPISPGIYKYFDNKGDLLYIGKAKNLRKRVSSYFTKHKNDSSRIKLLIRKIESIEFVIVNSEQDALLLENSLIKKYQPKYNIELKDDKTYPFIVIKNEAFPRVFFTRKYMLRHGEWRLFIFYIDIRFNCICVIIR